MMDALKKSGVTFYINAAACVLALIGWIVYLVTNATPGYAIMGGGTGIALGIIAVLLIVCVTFTSAKFGPQHIITAVIKLAALALLMGTFGVLMSDRAGLASSLFTWDSHNEVGWGVFYTSIASAVFLLLSSLALIINAFIDSKKA